MRYLTALTTFVLLAGWASAVEEADPILAKMQEFQNRHQIAEAIAYAKGIAASAGETPERRAKAFDGLADTYLAIGYPRLAIGTCRQAIAAFGGASEHSAAFWLRIAKIHAARDEVPEAAGVLDKAVAELDVAKLPLQYQAGLFGLLASCRDQLGQDQAALAAYEKLVVLPIKGPEAAAALAKAARLYAELQQFDKVEACLGRLDEKLGSEAVGTEAVKAYQELAGKLDAVGRPKEARALYRRMVGLFVRVQIHAAWGALQRLLEGAEGDAGAMDLVAGLKDDEARILAYEDAIGVLVPAALRTKRTNGLVKAYVRAELASPLEEVLGVACSRAIMEIRLREGRFGDALAAAAAAYSLTGSYGSYAASYARSVDLVSQALRARDGHLASGNAFRRYQVYGPAGPDGKLGTADDLANPLAKAAFQPEPEIDRLFDAALAAQPSTVAGRRARGYIYLLGYKPRKALSEFKRAFALANVESTELAKTAQDIALGLKALNGTPVGMDAFVLFQRHGPAGPDGKPGTPDDLKDPLADF